MTHKEALEKVIECGLNIEEPLHSEVMEIIKTALEKHSLIKAEAIKEFAERLKNCCFDLDDFPNSVVSVNRIDKLVKEMVGE